MHNTQKALELLRTVVQERFCDEVLQILDRYTCEFFAPAIDNAKRNQVSREFQKSIKFLCALRHARVSPCFSGINARRIKEGAAAYKAGRLLHAPKGRVNIASAFCS